ncbi:hypothetical protein MtrunA17_Chr7g0258561 [Medicago truncatula]|uniref:Transmembrane protein n=1 Tax=Medicago truncatula TaxID=3880 RepID=A0A396H9R3_MEDTR|nr:hypothetical protein MtrunA17_Chr7g0258561 [Medicago truncatula]
MRSEDLDCNKEFSALSEIETSTSLPIFFVSSLIVFGVLKRLLHVFCC